MYRFTAGLLAILFAGSFLTNAPAEAAEIEFEQVLTVQNNSEGTAEGTKTYTYTFSPVADPALLAIDTQNQIEASAGIAEGLEYDVFTLDLDYSVAAESSGVFNSNIEIPVDVSAFEEPGAYRYSLTVESLNFEDTAYFDVYIDNLGFQSCIFYDGEDFENAEITKISGFNDSLVIESAPEYETRTVIFRFVDTAGTLVSEDIIVQNRFLKARLVDTIDQALTQYQSTLNSLLGRNYRVISDDVAAHTGDSWFNPDKTPKVYIVLLESVTTPVPGPVNTPTSAPAPTNTPIPTSTPVPTSNPVPTNTPTPAETPRPPIASTGEAIAITSIVGVIFIGTGLILLTLSHKTRKNNTKEEEK